MSRIRSQLAFGDLTGGLNTTYNKENINSTPKKTETPDMVNVEYFKLGGIQTMKGNRKVGENNLSIQNSAVIAGWEYTKGNKRYMVIGLENGDVRLYDQSLDREDSEENPFKLIYKFPSSSSRMSFCNMNNGVVISNGIDDLAFFDIGTEKSLLGSVSFSEGNDIINGVDTFFTNELKVGKTVKINGCKNVYVVKEIISDTSIRVEPNIVLDDYRTYYEWDGLSTTHNIDLKIGNGNITEIPNYMPDVLDVYSLEEEQEPITHTIKHYAGICDYVSYNDIKSPLIVMTGRICRVNYEDNVTTFINDDPSSPVNHCESLTHLGYFKDTMGCVYLLNDDNTITRIKDNVLSLKGSLIIDNEYNLYKIINNELVLIDTNCKKIFNNNNEDIIFYVKEVDNILKLYYYSNNDFDYIGVHNGEVSVDPQSTFAIQDVTNINLTCGINRNTNEYTFPLVVNDNVVSYIRLNKDVDGPGSYANVMLFNIINNAYSQNYITGMIGYKKEYSDNQLTSHKLFRSNYIKTDTEAYGEVKTVLLSDVNSLDDGYVNCSVEISQYQATIYHQYAGIVCGGQNYGDIVSNKNHCSYYTEYRSVQGKFKVIFSRSITFLSRQNENNDGYWSSPYMYIDIDIDSVGTNIELHNCFITSNGEDGGNSWRRTNKYCKLHYIDNYTDFNKYLTWSRMTFWITTNLDCYQDSYKYEIDGVVTFRIDDALLQPLNLTLNGVIIDYSTTYIANPFKIQYDIYVKNGNIYTTSVSRYATDIYSEPNSDSLKTNEHEPYSANQIYVYGNELEPSIEEEAEYTLINNNAENGIYTYDPLNQVKVYDEEPYTDGAAIYISDVQMLNAYITNSDPDVATGSDINVPVRGLALQHYQGRLWVGGETGLFYSAVGLPNNWDIYSDAGVIYDIYNDSSSVKALGLFSEYLIVHKEFSTYILTCSDLGSTIEIKPFSNITCESQQSWIVSNTKYYVYSKDFMDIYPLVQHTVFNDKFLGEPITQKVRDIFHNLRNGDTDKIFCVSRPLSRQMIFYLPTINRSGSGEAIIFDFQTKSFLFRRLPKDTEVTIAFNYNNDIYLGTRDGLVLKEFTGDSFIVLKDGVLEERGLEAYYKSPWFDWIGGYTQSFAEFFVELDNEHKNNFWIRTQKDGQSRYEDRKIDLDKINRSKKYLIWAGDEEPKDSKWNEKYWEKKRFENIRMLLPNNVFEDFQVEFRAIKKGEHFCIYQYGFRRIETEEDPW